MRISLKQFLAGHNTKQRQIMIKKGLIKLSGVYLPKQRTFPKLRTFPSQGKEAEPKSRRAATKSKRPTNYRDSRSFKSYQRNSSVNLARRDQRLKSDTALTRVRPKANNDGILGNLIRYNHRHSRRRLKMAERKRNKAKGIFKKLNLGGNSEVVKNGRVATFYCDKGNVEIEKETEKEEEGQRVREDIFGKIRELSVQKKRLKDELRRSLMLSKSNGRSLLGARVGKYDCWENCDVLDSSKLKKMKDRANNMKSYGEDKLKIGYRLPKSYKRASVFKLKKVKLKPFHSIQEDTSEVQIMKVASLERNSPKQVDSSSVEIKPNHDKLEQDELYLSNKYRLKYTKSINFQKDHYIPQTYMKRVNKIISDSDQNYLKSPKLNSRNSPYMRYKGANNRAKGRGFKAETFNGWEKEDRTLEENQNVRNMTRLGRLDSSDSIDLLEYTQ